MKLNALHLVLLYGVLGLLLPAAPALAMSAECESLISPRSSESVEQMSARMAALQKCFDAEVSERAQAIPVLKSTGKCPVDLSYLDARLPRYPGDAEYSKIRAMALRENMVEDLAKARNMGLTVAQAAEDALVQVKIAEAMEGSMADLARAYNNTDAATLAQLKNGTYAYRGGTLPLAYQGYLAAYIGAVVNREAAAAIACIARHELQSDSLSSAVPPPAGAAAKSFEQAGTRTQRAQAGTGDTGQAAKPSAQLQQAQPLLRNPSNAGAETVIRKTLLERLPQFPSIEEVTRSPVPGLWEVRYGGTELLYTDDKGEYIFVNSTMVETRTGTDLTRLRREKLLVVSWDKLPLQDAVTTRQGTGARKIAVFVDPNCGYCKRLERDLAAVKDLSIYTFLIPILGPDSTVKSHDLWCAAQPAKAWRSWMLDGVVPAKAAVGCDTAAVERNLEFARANRINATPALYLEDGTRKEGALATAVIEKMLLTVAAKK